MNLPERNPNRNHRVLEEILAGTRQALPGLRTRRGELERAAAEIRSATLTYLRTQVKDELALLREQLSPDDQAILILRVDRKLAWLDVARALAGEDDLPDDELVRSSARLRKRFGRIKAELKQKLETRPALRR